eukprot:5270336-Pyramimonas_sp.AAC.1
MQHVGITYEKITRGYKHHQTEFALAIKLVEIPKGASDDTKLTATQTTLLRGAVGALLFLCYTRVDILADVVVLQQHVCSAKIIHLKMANTITRRAWQHSHLGLIF